MRVLVVILSVFWLAGCSVLMALEGNTDRDYSLFKRGTPRKHVLARYGPPLSTEIKEGKRVDIYEFEEGDEPAPQRVGVHLMADVITWGAWELIATPYEYFQGEDVRYVVEYGYDDTVESVSPPPPGISLASVTDPTSLGSALIETSPSLATFPTVSPSNNEVDDIPVLVNQPIRTKSYAVIVGIETYRDHLPNADYASHDARVVAKYLTHALGYPEENVVTLLDNKATRADLHKYFEGWLSNRVEQNDSVFIYYSGHGAPNIKTGEAYLVPYDGDPLYIDKTGYSLQSLYDHLNTLPAGEVVVVLDSCFSGAGGRSVIAKGMRPLILSVENPILSQGKTFVLGASAGDQVSNTYEEKKHGLLTYFFLKGLQGEGDQNQDGTIDLRELYTYLKPEVERVARREFNNEQIPQLLGDPEGLSSGVWRMEMLKAKVANLLTVPDSQPN